jgi:hypothetical protein
MTIIDKKLSIEIIEKINLQSKSVCKDLGTTKVVFLLSTVPPNIGFTKEKHIFIIISGVFSRAAKLAQVCSIVPSALKRARVFKVLTVWQLMMTLGFQLTWHMLNCVS